MDEKKAFAILGAEITKEENVIKDAYRAKLKLVNPEDDPEGFKQLRAAYEAALSYAASREKENEEIDETPSGLFVQKAAALYESIEGRQDENAWRRLFQEPAFLDLEEEENCREKLLAWMMNHCYLPTQIWKVLDEKLQIAEEKEALYEKFPKDFIDFAVRKIQKGEDFEFEQLEGPEGSDLDDWIFLFAKAGREESDKNYDAMEQTIQEAEEKGISHPALSMMKARLLCEKDRKEEGDRIVEALLEGPFAETLNVRYQSAEYWWQSGRTEKAVPLFLKIKEENKGHYMANRRLAQWHLEKGAFSQAKECVNVLLSYPLDDECRELVNRVNTGLEAELTARLTEMPQDLKARMDLCWCHLQNEKPETAIALMEGIVPLPEQEKDYVNLMGKVYYYAKQYDRAEPVIRRWAVLLEEQMPEEAREAEDDEERLATAHSMLSQILTERAKQAEGTEREDAFGAAVRELDKAERAHYNPGQEYGKASVFWEWGKYEECVKICGKLTEEYPDFSAAFVLHQKACAKLFDASGVIGDYFALRRLMPDYMPSWELAAEVYYQLKRPEDLDQLLADAEQNQTLTPCLKKYRFQRMAEQAENKKELTDALEYAQKVSEEWEQEEGEEDNKAELYSERARNYWRLEEYETALELIGKAISLSGNLMYVYIRAGIKKDQGEYEEALECYLKCRAEYDETPHFYSNIGECYYKLGRYGDALPNLKKAVEIKPDNPVCCAWIIRILKREMEKKEQLDQMEEARRYADLMIEHRPESFFFIERGLLYVLAQDYESAAGDFEQAVKADDKDPFAYSNLARMYRLLDRLPEAEEQARLAVKNMEFDPAPYHHEVLGNVYWQMRRYEDAAAAFRTNWERYPDQRVKFIDDMVTLYLDMGKWQDAMELLKKVYRESDKEYGKKTVEIYCSAGFFEEAVRFVKHHYKMAGFDEKQMQETLADIYWYQGNLKKAAWFITKALKNYPAEKGHYPVLCRRAAGIFFFMGKRDMARLWANRALRFYEGQGGFEKWLNPPDGGLNRMYLFGCLQLYAGNRETAMQMVKEMKQRPRCTYCTHCCCTDAWELEAGILTADGDYAGAAEIYERILKESGRDKDVKMKLGLLKKDGKL